MTIFEKNLDENKQPHSRDFMVVEGQTAAADDGAPENQDQASLLNTSQLEVVANSLSEDELERITQDLVAAFKTIYDPEIPVDIYELGLIYKAEIDDNRFVKVDMTLTAPGCPVAGELVAEAQQAVSMVPGVMGVEVNLVFDPPWDVSRMSEEARFSLNWY